MLNQCLKKVMDVIPKQKASLLHFLKKSRRRRLKKSASMGGVRVSASTVVWELLFVIMGVERRPANSVAEFLSASMESRRIRAKSAGGKAGA
jgi:hypothetical protein